MIHQGVSIYQCSFHLNQLNIAVSKSESIVKNVAISLVSCLSIAILANDVLDCVNFISTVVGIYNNVASASVGRLNNTHDLSGTLSGCLCSTFLLCSGLSFIFSLGVALIIQMLLALLQRVASLLFGRDHGCYYVTVLPRSLLAILRNVWGCLWCLAWSSIGVGPDGIRHRVGPRSLGRKKATICVRVSYSNSTVWIIDCLSIVWQLLVACTELAILLRCTILLKSCLLSRLDASTLLVLSFTSLGHLGRSLSVRYSVTSTWYPTFYEILLRAWLRLSTYDVHTIITKARWHSLLACWLFLASISWQL